MIGLPRCLAAAAALLSLASGHARAEGGSVVPEPREVEVRLSAPLGPVPELATAGFNYGNTMRVVGHQEAFDALRVGTLRYPPGNQADEIEVGPHDLAALAMNLDLLGRPPVVMVVNLFGGTPEGAAELARATRRAGIPVLAWEIGNEPDLYATNRGDPSWTPERWCEAFRATAAALREVEADAVVAGPGVSGSRPGGEDFLKDVLYECGDAMEILTWHLYPTDGTWSDEAALATAASFGEEVTRYRGWAGDPDTNPLGWNRELAFGVTEFGLSWRSSSFRHLEDMTAALWLADVLGQMTRERLDLGHYFALQAMGGHGLIDIGGWIRPTYYVYAMLASFVGEALQVETTAPLRAYAVRNAGGTEVLLVNPTDEAWRVRLDFGAPVVGESTLVTLDEAAFEADGASRTALAPATRPVPVPARAVVHVHAPAALP